MNTHVLRQGGFPGFLATCRIGGIRVAFDNPENLGSQVLERLSANHTETKSLLEKNDGRVSGVEARLTDIEQKLVRRPGAPEPLKVPRSFGERFVESDEFKAFSERGKKGTARLEVKAITSASTPAAAGSAYYGGGVAPDLRAEVIALPRIRPIIRDLVQPGRTTSNSVRFVRQTIRLNAAAAVAENPSAPKPESNLMWEEISNSVETIAHYVLASRQIIDDAPALMSIINGELYYGLELSEEIQLLLGDGTGSNLLGLMPQASTFAAPFPITSPTMLDVLLQALAQADASLLPADGIVLNTLDHRKMQAIKDTQGRYIGGGPYEQAVQRVWDTPMVSTNVMPQNQFLVGAFKTGCQIFDRQDAEIVVSSEDRDNFVKNMWTIRAEERLAFVVKRPNAFIKGTFASGN